MFTLKFNYNGDTRRATLTEESQPDYARIETYIRELYGESIPQDRHLKLKYVDDEGDTISVSCDHDLREAFLFRAVTNRTTLRVDVIITERVAVPSAPEGKVVANEGVKAASVTQEWGEKVRGRFRGIVDACQKIGVLLQKKIEEKRLAKMLEAVADQEAEKEQAEKEEKKEEEEEAAKKKKEQEEAASAAVTQPTEEEATKAEPQQDKKEEEVQTKEEEIEKKEEDVENQEKEKETEKEKEPEPDFKPPQISQTNMNPAVVVQHIPAGPQKSEWREMLRMYELSVEEMAELRILPRRNKNNVGVSL